jgi:hypothetical protein
MIAADFMPPDAFDRRAPSEVLGEIAPHFCRPDDVEHAHRETLLRVVVLPAAAAIKLGEVGQPPISQIAPLAGDFIAAESAWSCRHELSVASADPP